MKRLPIIPTMIATGFGAGFWPWGPGTAGAVLATSIWLVLSQFLMPTTTMLTTGVLIVVFTWLGTWATAKLTPHWGDDPSRVVIDEMIGVWVPLLLAYNWWTALTALFLFRFFDIVKPLGIRSLDRRKGAFWVMADDLLAGIYSAIVLAVIIYISSTWAR
ncbi:phosphatidylglycerophosphatase A [Prevotella sp. E13-17]|uniref:phosphatidylglycerophosphatase A family protein n=1 Tax=Prevotella sp. E13-17 TaxID=2913616 RepID=UPI001ED9F513|nr:phosphatidylglycerophosphatase A [Prevotella sp. E13-17]UKK50291.1 phosphatidylglycerophosphatase A [Prevotella sp. E13-17]